MGLLAAFATIYFGLDTFHGYMDHRIDYIGLALMARLVLLAGAIVALLFSHWFIRNFWFFIYEFNLDGNSLEINDPILRKQRVIMLDQVSTISTFDILGPVPGSAAVSGYLLKTDDGSSVTLSGALPICQEILQKCDHATFDKINMMNFR